MTYLKAREVAEGVYWVGAIDWNVRDFHGYSTNKGTTYNAYLIIDEKITLVDTVKRPFMNEMVERIRSIIDPSKIDYIISNHSEMDHSGSLKDMIDLVHPEKVFASPMGIKALTAHFGELPLTAVKSGDEISLGKNTVSFLETRMLHWPDSMFTYLKELEILFSQDAFGMHLATEKMFSDELDSSLIKTESEKYFANILMLYAPQILQLREQLKNSPLNIRLMIPDHGPIHRNAWISKMVAWYVEWSTQIPKKKAIVVYDSMWGSTHQMGVAIAEGIRSTGVDVKMFSMGGSHRSDIATESLDAGALVFGSPTLNNGLFPTIADVLCYLKGLRPKNKIAGSFGSYGWGGEAVAQLNEQLKNMNFQVIESSVRCQYVPTADKLEECRAYGQKIGEALNLLISQIRD